MNIINFIISLFFDGDIKVTVIKYIFTSLLKFILKELKDDFCNFIKLDFVKKRISDRTLKKANGYCLRCN